MLIFAFVCVGGFGFLYCSMFINLLFQVYLCHLCIHYYVLGVVHGDGVRHFKFYQNIKPRVTNTENAILQNFWLPIEIKRCRKKCFHVNFMKHQFIRKLVVIIQKHVFVQISQYFLHISSKNRRVTSNDAEQWIPIIKSTYPENIPFPQSKIVVCDLHFNQDSILDLGKRRQLIPGSVPNIGYAVFPYSAKMFTVQL